MSKLENYSNFDTIYVLFELKLIFPYSTKQDMVPDPTSLILTKKLSISGFHFFDYMNNLEEGRTQLSTWLKNGQLKLAQETILHGFEKMPEALIGLFEQTSNNLGKVIVQAYPNGNQ